MPITLELTTAQATFLLECLEDHTDCGPENEGWKSTELMEMTCWVANAIQQAQKEIKETNK